MTKLCPAVSPGCNSGTDAGTGSGVLLASRFSRIWTGAITFGLVNVPVKVYSATEDHDVSLHQMHDVDGGRIRY